MFKNYVRPLFDANAAGGGVSANGEGSAAVAAKGEGETLTFDAWRETLPDDQKGLIESHTKGLKSALDSEREIRKSLEKQLREMAKASEKGSDSQTQLTQLADNLQAADRKADFYEAAHAAGVKNLKLAFTVATQDEMFDKRGQVNFDEMKKDYPELFGATQPAPRGDAGSGTNQQTVKPFDMDEFIRGKARRK